MTPENGLVEELERRYRPAASTPTPCQIERYILEQIERNNGPQSEALTQPFSQPTEPTEDRPRRRTRKKFRR